MTALTERKVEYKKEGRLVSMKIKAGVTIYEGAFLKILAGYVSPASPEAGASFIGVACETVENSLGANGDFSVLVERKQNYIMKIVGATQAVVGSEVRLVDDATVQVAALANSQICGKIVEFLSATSVVVETV